MTEALIGNVAGIVFFAIATIGVITAVIRRRKRLLKARAEPQKAYDLDGSKETEVKFETSPDVDVESDVDKLLSDLKGDEISRD